MQFKPKTTIKTSAIILNSNPRQSVGMLHSATEFEIVLYVGSPKASWQGRHEARQSYCLELPSLGVI